LFLDAANEELKARFLGSKKHAVRPQLDRS